MFKKLISNTVFRKSMEWFFIPLLLSIMVGPYIVELACEWRKESVFRFRVMRSQQGKEEGLANVGVDIIGLDTYNTDSAGYFNLVVKNNRSVVPFITCSTCPAQQLYHYIVYFQGREARDSVLIDVVKNKDKSTQIIYAP